MGRSTGAPTRGTPLPIISVRVPPSVPVVLQAAADPGYDTAAHPWRPFDREKDMGPGLDAKKNAAELLKGERALGSKFAGSQGGGRTFL